MSRESTSIDQLDQAVETATRLVLALPSAYAILRAESTTYHLAAQSYDSPQVSGFSTELDDDGHPIPVRPDPVGRHVADGVTSYDERARQIIAAARAVCTAVGGLEKLVAPLMDDHHRATTPRAQLEEEAKADALEEARLERENDHHCRSCLRIEVRTPVAKRRAVDGDVWGLCRWCYDFHRDVGNLPSREELTEHHAGGIVRRRVAP